MPVTHMRRGVVLEIGNDEDDAKCLGAMCAEPWCERDAAAAALRLVGTPATILRSVCAVKPVVAVAIREPSTKRRLVYARRRPSRSINQ